MNLFDRLNRNIDYNNSHSIRRPVGILEHEFELAVKENNKHYAIEVMDTARKIYDELSSTYRESADYGETMSYMQKVWAQRLRNFIGYLAKRLKNDFGIQNDPTIYTE
jgi:uncharacterized protein YfbU (UPF0304 family)